MPDALGVEAAEVRIRSAGDNEDISAFWHSQLGESYD